MRKFLPYITLGGKLFVITFVVALLVAVVNQLTAPKIASNSEKSRIVAIESVIGKVNDSGKNINFSKSDTCVTEIIEFNTNKGKAYAVSASPIGYGGEVKMIIGVNDKLEVTGVSIIDMKETPGLGTKAKDSGFLSRFIGKNKEVTAITGATITSKAVKKGVSDAVKKVGELHE